MAEQQPEIQPMEADSAEEDEVPGEEIPFEVRFQALQDQWLPEGVSFIPPDCVDRHDMENLLEERDNIISLLTAQVRRLKGQLKAVRLAARDDK
jgi:hypothetical protein